MKVELQRVAPAEIEKRSMEIITAELGERSFPPEVLPVVKRVIHTSADFDYADNLVFSPDAVARGIEAIRNGCTIVTDTQMAWSGVNKRVLEKFGGRGQGPWGDPCHRVHGTGGGAGGAPGVRHRQRPHRPGAAVPAHG